MPVMASGVLRVIAYVACLLATAPAAADNHDLTDDHHHHAEHEERNPEFEPFLKAGYRMVEWNFNETMRDRIYKNIVLPDFLERTKLAEPRFPSFDYALENLTGGDFNDVVIWSRLPGDCNERGCMAAVFHLTGDKWQPVARFQAIAVMHRYAPGEDRIPELVAVGDAMNPSAIFRWDGTQFLEMR